MQRFRSFLLLCVALLNLSPLSAQADMKPLSAADRARVEQLLRNFDPNSYHLVFPATTNNGKVERRSVGMASLRQMNTVRFTPHGNMAAGTNTNINIFKQAASTNTNINIFRPVASTNTNINIFRPSASTNTNINIFKPAQVRAANEINAIFAKYLSAQP